MRNLKSFKTVFYDAVRLYDRLFPAKTTPQTSDIPITIFTPAVPKHLRVFRHSLPYTRKNLGHPLKEVVLCGPSTPEMRQFCDEFDCRLLPEEEVLGFSLSEFSEAHPEHIRDRPHWIYQQLLKLNCDQAVKTDHILVLDSDTILMRPRIFKSGNTLFQDFSHERNPLYWKSMRSLLGIAKPHRLSFVVHHMFAERHILEDYRRTIQDNTGMEWWKAIQDAGHAKHWTESELRTGKDIPFNYFSEYESYANFAHRYYDKVKISYFLNYNGAGQVKKASAVPGVLENLPSLFKWASFHQQKGCILDLDPGEPY